MIKWSLGITALVLLFLVDLLWLSVMFSRFYQHHLAHLLTDRLDVLAAVVFYCLYAASLTYLILMPAFHHASYADLGMRAWVFGVTAYGTYDLTNQATLKDWSMWVSVVDMFWGGALTSFVAIASVWLVRMLLRTL